MKNDKLKLGVLCKDAVTGFEGIIASKYEYLTGCDFYALMAIDTNEKDDAVKIIEAQRVQYIDDKFRKSLEHQPEYDKPELELGSLAKDVLTGFTGILYARAQNLYSCDTYNIVPKSSRKKPDVDSKWVDDARVEVIEHEKISINSIYDTSIGGPAPSWSPKR